MQTAARQPHSSADERKCHPAHHRLDPTRCCGSWADPAFAIVLVLAISALIHGIGTAFEIDRKTTSCNAEKCPHLDWVPLCCISKFTADPSNALSPLERHEGDSLRICVRSLYLVPEMI